MESNQDLAGKVVVVTGAGRGIGKQIAIGAGQRGASVALVEVIPENLEAATKEIAAMGIKVKGYLTDLSIESDVVDNFKQIEKDFGQIDCLVNNAMIHNSEDLLATTLDIWNKSLAVTLTVAVRYGPDGIRCTTVVPGTIATDAWQERVDRNPQIFDKLKPWYPLGRVGTPADVTEAVLFILSDKAQWISGSEFVVDGGLLAGLAPMYKMVEGSD